MSGGDWFSPIDNYCERLDASLFSEPLNAISNGAFLIAAFVLFMRYRAVGRRDFEVLALIALVAVVGLGSLAFHTFANGLSMMADVMPTAVLVVTYIWVAFRRLLLWRGRSALGAIALFFVAAFIVGMVPQAYAFNGSIAYLPCFGVLLFLWAQLAAKQHVEAITLKKAVLVFMASLTFRSVDMQWCAVFPLGTHFLWHCFNGILLTLLVRAVLRKD